jgi:hypothetical protein
MGLNRPVGPLPPRTHTLEFSGLHGMSLPTTLAQARTSAEMWRRRQATIGGRSCAGARQERRGDL